MSETKWTPGPWEIVSKFVGPYELHSNGSAFARVEADRDVLELIASALALYEALEAILKIEDEDGLGTAYARYNGKQRDALEKARAALAAARGETP